MLMVEKAMWNIVDLPWKLVAKDMLNGMERDRKAVMRKKK